MKDFTTSSTTVLILTLGWSYTVLPVSGSKIADVDTRLEHGIVTRPNQTDLRREAEDAPDFLLSRLDVCVKGYQIKILAD